MQEIEVFEAGYNRLLTNLERQGFLPLFIYPINEGRYLIVKGTLYDNPYNILIAYKREFFLSFGKLLKDQGARGIGESLNVNDIQTAIQKEVTAIFFIYPTAQVYSISMQDFLNQSIRWTNKENKDVRSISIHTLKSEGKI